LTARPNSPEPVPGTSLGTWQHLASRLVSVVLAKGLKPGEVDEIGFWLSREEGKAFFAQPGYDQRHGLESARHVLRRLPQREDLVRAALLHDIGKRHSDLGPLGRSLASIHAKLGGTARGRWRSYLEHGQWAGAELQTLGAEPIVVDFARHHHGERPESIAEAEWALLQAADKA
jgi:HD domain-containing protein